jgi:hypothetical protein
MSDMEVQELFKSLIGAVALCSVFFGGSAVAGGTHYEQDMDTAWEVLWHQSGVPTRLVRWEQDIRVRVQGVDLAAHRDYTLAALREVAAETGVRVVDVTAAGAAGQPNLDIEIVGNAALEHNQPCVTELQYTTETRIERATLKMRSGDVRRCTHHELMHVMGLRGHPAGKTVLSYFPTKVDGLLPLDRSMLRAWYSPRARGGMTPFEILPVLAEQIGTSVADQGEAARARQRFYSRTVDAMRAFADGKGDAPSILARSGKITAQGVQYGRQEMGYFLGLAYLDGQCVAPDPAQGQQWLQRAATLGNRAALARLSGSPRS